MPNFQILEGHWLDKAREIPDASVHVCVTSPPYWGLRNYSTPPQVWGGQADCEHEWGERIAGNNRGGSGTPTGRNGRGEEYARALPKGNICAKCGAWRGELGQEPTPDLYIQHLVEVFREVRRVLRGDGLVWINIGDSYATGAGKVGDHPGGGNQGARWKGEVDHSKGRGTPSRADGTGGHSYIGPAIQMNRLPIAGRKAGDLVGIPWLLAFALQADGWWLRRDNIWAKVNCMPESVTGTRWEKCRVKTGQQKGAGKQPTNQGSLTLQTGSVDIAEWADCPGCKKCEPNDGLILRRGSGRSTTSHEYIFMLAKSADYFYDSDAVAEKPTSGPSDIKKMIEQKERIGGKTLTATDPLYAANNGTNIGNKRGVGDPTQRNKRSVWTITSQPYIEDHFAAFPEELPETCIKASTSERGVCANCGAPWARVVRTETETETEQVYGERDRLAFPGRNGEGVQKRAAEIPATKSTLGWRATCKCNAGDPIPATVLDPFLGRGTTGAVSVRLGRNFIGCDLQPNYIKMARKNINNEAPLFVKETT